MYFPFQIPHSSPWNIFYTASKVTPIEFQCIFCGYFESQILIPILVIVIIWVLNFGNDILAFHSEGVILTALLQRFLLNFQLVNVEQMMDKHRAVNWTSTWCFFPSLSSSRPLGVPSYLPSSLTFALDELVSISCQYVAMNNSVSPPTLNNQGWERATGVGDPDLRSRSFYLPQSLSISPSLFCFSASRFRTTSV